MDYAIFYNVFVDPQNWNASVDIIQQQTGQFHRVLKRRNLLDRVPVYYNMIGYHYQPRFGPPDLTYHLLQYYDRGSEDVTLQDVFDYCHQFPDDAVYYFHNKGSFHASPVNDRLRQDYTRLLMKRAHKLLDLSSTSGEQLQPPPASQDCNVVSNLWHPLPHWHTAANFWLAKCSYVRNLISPDLYDNARVAMFRKLLHSDHRSMNSSLYCLRSFFTEATEIYQQPALIQDTVGVGRYNWEMWIYSHPDVVPCDLELSIFRTNVTDRKAFHVDPAAQFEWSRMHGRLYEFYQLYHQLPKKESFFWKYYQGAKEAAVPPECQTWNRSGYYI